MPCEDPAAWLPEASPSTHFADTAPMQPDTPGANHGGHEASRQVSDGRAKMKLGIMQPYFFPYIGYFQLLKAVDTFVFYDDVQYTKRSWINRNRVQHDGKPRWFTVPVLGASQSRRIDEVRVSGDSAWRRKMIRGLEESYARAPHRARVVEIVRTVFESPAVSIAELARTSVELVAQYLGIGCHIVPSSSAYENRQLRGQERIVDICRREDATCYVNLPGGRTLYDDQGFQSLGIELCFVEPRAMSYYQGLAQFLPNLSMLDVLMWCSLTEARALLAEFDVR